jgi:hypothetical protein
MTSPGPTDNLPSVNGDAREDRSDWPAIGARVHPDELKLIDLARIHGDYAKRGDMIREAVLEKAREILRARRESDELLARRAAAS